MTVTMADYHEVRLMPGGHDPWAVNGELAMSKFLARRGIVFEYESRYYPLVYSLPGTSSLVFGGFRPDFHCPDTADRPAINIELTFADRFLAQMIRTQLQASQLRLELKRLKIELTSQIYGIETILVTHAIYVEIMRNPKRLDQLINRAVARHRRRVRRGSLEPDELTALAA